MKRTGFVVAALAILTLLSGCWGAAWPSRGVVVDLKRANASYTQVLKEADTFLLSHELKRIGKGGFDAINNTTTSLDYEGPGRLFVSVGPDGTMEISRVEKVLIKFNQDGDSFSAESSKTLESLIAMLNSRWPGAAEQVEKRRAP